LLAQRARSLRNRLSGFYRRVLVRLYGVGLPHTREIDHAGQAVRHDEPCERRTGAGCDPEDGDACGMKMLTENVGKTVLETGQSYEVCQAFRIAKGGSSDGAVPGGVRPEAPTRSEINRKR
jgi:hypothetical protein